MLLRRVWYFHGSNPLAHSIEGDYNYSSRSEIEALMNGDAAGRLSR
jgi:hypothetical protein